MKSLVLVSMSLILAFPIVSSLDHRVLAAQAKADKQELRVEGKEAKETGKPTEKDIPVNLVSKFFKAQSHALAAQTALDQTPQSMQLKEASTKFQVVLQEMQAFCGKEFTLMIDNKTEDPACAPIEKPKETPKDTKPAETKTSPK